MSLKAPLTMPTLRIELGGVKEAVLVAITDAHQEMLEAIKLQLSACLQSLTPEEIIASVRRSFESALHKVVREVGPELVEQAVIDYFTEGEGAAIVRKALTEKFKI